MPREGQTKAERLSDRKNSSQGDWERHKLEQRGRKKEAQKSNRRVRKREGTGGTDREKKGKGTFRTRDKGRGKDGLTEEEETDREKKGETNREIQTQLARRNTRDRESTRQVEKTDTHTSILID